MFEVREFILVKMKKEPHLVDLWISCGHLVMPLPPRRGCVAGALHLHALEAALPPRLVSGAHSRHARRRPEEALVDLLLLLRLALLSAAPPSTRALASPPPQPSTPRHAPPARPL